MLLFLIFFFQYVVLEVIQLPENAENNMDIKPKINLKTPPKAIKSPAQPVNIEKKRADIASAFGFDDEDDD